MNIFTALFSRDRSHDLPTAPTAHSQRPFSTSDSIPELILAMRASNGYSRQAAIARSVVLAHAELFPEIADRLNDWVPQVRDCARSAMITLLPVIPAQHVVATLPRIAQLRHAGRLDHCDWLDLFEREMLKWVDINDLVAAVDGADIKIARASFDLLKRHALLDLPGLQQLAVNARRDIVLAQQGVNMIDALPAQVQSAQYRLALKSHFGAVRTAALRALLQRASESGLHEIATGLLLDPQASVRSAAIFFLVGEKVDVRAHCHGLLNAATRPANVVRICLGILAGLGHSADIELVSSFKCDPLISVRVAAYSAWLKLAEKDKDAIACHALTDDAKKIRQAALNMTRRHSAFIAFDTVLAQLMARRDWSLLLQFSQLEKWNWLEAIAKIALAADPQDAIKPVLKRELETWLCTVGSYTRPVAAQLEFLQTPATMAALNSLRPDTMNAIEVLEREIAVASAKQR